MISHILETVTVGASSGVEGWETHALSSTHDIECGDYFTIIFIDDDAATNPEDNNEARVYQVNTYASEPTMNEHRSVAQAVYPWKKSTDNLEIGTLNSAGSGDQTQYLVDFKGSVF